MQVESCCVSGTSKFFCRCRYEQSKTLSPQSKSQLEVHCQRLFFFFATFFSLQLCVDVQTLLDGARMDRTESRRNVQEKRIGSLFVYEAVISFL